MAELLGYIGCIAFSLCAIPQAWESYLAGHSRGLSSWFLWLWLIGEVAYIIAVPLSIGYVDWLMLNYVFNLLALVVIIRYKIRPRNGT